MKRKLTELRPSRRLYVIALVSGVIGGSIMLLTALAGGSGYFERYSKRAV